MKSLLRKFIKIKQLAASVLLGLLLAACTQGGVGGSNAPAGRALDGETASLGVTNQAAGPAERPPLTLAGDQVPWEFFQAHCNEVGKDENGEAIYECDFGKPDWQQFSFANELRGRLQLKSNGRDEFVVIRKVDFQEQLEIRDEAAGERLREILAGRGEPDSGDEDDSEEENEFRFRRINPIIIPANE